MTVAVDAHTRQTNSLEFSGSLNLGDGRGADAEKRGDLLPRHEHAVARS